ncbi:LytTR family DNA-binding domain-containing protein [uncultured Aquimarina sp.]|uniref:LytR/AlgR family response regulator transcription factor n=1 Tax=uncultured Aquimarina sp. TaxID=575652 RepID=UPI002636F6D7|nr:LytTR family DNA-binding domain-containing protein [uncultured Aquimarina sp.]
METYNLDTNDSYLEELDIDINDLKNASLSNLGTSLTVQKQVIKHTPDGIIIGFYIRSKHASLGLTKKVNSLYKNPMQFPTFQEEVKIEKKENKEPSYLFVKCGNKLIKVAINTIIFAHTDSKNYCSIITSDGKKLSVRHSITSLLKALNCDFFIQTHRSYIINWHKIDSFYEQDQTIEIQKHHIPVGRTYKEELYKKIRVI